MKRPPPDAFRGWRRGGMVVAGLFYCSLLGLAAAPQRPDPEKQELKIAVDLLRKETVELRKLGAARQRELALATNKLAVAERKAQGAKPVRIADEEEARTAAEWRAFLQSALKILEEADREAQALRKRLQLLGYASKEAFKSAEKVDPAKRALLEGELRQSEKILSRRKEEEGQPRAFLREIDDGGGLTRAKVVGVRLDLGVAALAVGRHQGARVGMPFLVVRDKKVLAVLTLAEVREGISLALIDRMEPDQPIREGDMAELRKA